MGHGGSLERGAPASQILARSGVGQPSCIDTLRTQKLGIIAVIDFAKYAIFPKNEQKPKSIIRIAN